MLFTARSERANLDISFLESISQDHFQKGGKRKSPLNAFLANQSAILHEARRKYLQNQFEPQGTILIKGSDIL